MKKPFNTTQYFDNQTNSTQGATKFHKRHGAGYFRNKAVAGILAVALISGSAVGTAGCSQTSESSGTTTTTATAVDTSLFDLEYSKKDLDGSYEESESVSIALSDIGSAATVGSNCTVDVSSAVIVDGSTITINDEGTYILSGTLSDGQIVVAAEDSDKVKLVLNGVTITNDDGPAIYAKSADKVFVTLADDSKNSVSDGKSYTLESDSDEPNATIFAKCDLTINGDGTLDVDANYMHGILSKDELKVTGGTITVDAAQDGIRGRDSLMINGGTITVTAGDDALKSSNDEDVSKGFIVIDSGTITINAKDDAVHAETALLVRDGTINIESCEEGYEATLVQIDGGVSNIVSNDDGINASAGSVFDTSSSDTTLAGDSTNAADSKATGSSDATSANAANSSDNAADNSSASNLPQGNLPSGQAPGSSDTNSSSDGSSGNQPPQKPEGNSNSFSNQQVQKPDGNGGGAPGSNSGGGEERVAACRLVINGGVVTIDSEGDALDSNGDIAIAGGTVLASGSSGEVEVAMDYNGTSTISGGTVVLAGASGMAQSFSSGDQAFAMVSASGSAGQTITLADEKGNAIVTYTATNKFGNVVVSSPELTSGTSYQVVVNGTVSGSSTDGNGITTGGTVSGGTTTTITASTEGSSGNGQMDGKPESDSKETGGSKQAS